MSPSISSAEHAGGDVLVTVGSFPDLATAGVARSALEAAGIQVLLRSGNANGLMPFAFESQLQVRASDEMAALQLLENAQQSPASETEVLAAEQAQEAAGQELPLEGTED